MIEKQRNRTELEETEHESCLKKNRAIEESSNHLKTKKQK
jgi:hypothetical protein